MANALKTPARTASRTQFPPGRTPEQPGKSGRAVVPTVSPFLSWGFGWYVHRYLRRHFNAVRVAKQTKPDLPKGEVVICYMNHPGWWDPLVGYFLNSEFLDGRTAYAPIDIQALEQYPVFRKLGFYGVDLNSFEGAKQFLAITREVIKKSQVAIWITPTGRFVDVRARSEFQPGLGHLAASAGGVMLLPVAVEYTFWEERTPEALVEFGPVIRTTRSEQSKNDWQSELESQLASAQARLAKKAIARDASQFDVALGGQAGVGGWYDFARRTRSRLNGTDFDPRHGRTPKRSSL